MAVIVGLLLFLLLLSEGDGTISLAEAAACEARRLDDKGGGIPDEVVIVTLPKSD